MTFAPGLALMMAVLTLAGCFVQPGPVPITPTRSMMVGTWVGHGGAVLTLNSDGSFTARELPANPGESSYGTVPRQGSGRWHVGPVPAEPPGVVFDFSPTVQMELLVERDGSSVVMYYDKGDPDQGVSGQFQFEKTK